MSEDAGGETPQLPIIRKTFIVVWKDDITTFTNITGSASLDALRILVMHGEDGVEHWINLDNVIRIEVITDE